MNLASILKKQAKTEQSQAFCNADWLQQHMSSHFFQAMNDEQQALTWLARDMDRLHYNHSLILTENNQRLILARTNLPGSLYSTLLHLGERRISYAMFSHSNAPMPGMDVELEVSRFEFETMDNEEFNGFRETAIPAGITQQVRLQLKQLHPEFKQAKLQPLLNILWINNKNFVAMAAPSQLASLLWLFDRSNSSGGISINISQTNNESIPETRILFAVGNPHQEDFLLQLLEVFNRLGLGIRRAYCLNIFNGVHPYFLGDFFIQSHHESSPIPDKNQLDQLSRELCATQIISASSPIYHAFVRENVFSGDDAALINAFISFCHTSLAHNQPERFNLEQIQRAFTDHPEMSQLLLQLFKTRFSPEPPLDDKTYQQRVTETTQTIEEYNIGHRWLDDIRRSIYRCGLLLITHSLKTNFFVVEKQALAFRLDPDYLIKLGHDFIADLPDSRPFRVTFFYSRFGAGYQIGFSDIARGGWRTVIARSSDDYITTSSTIFREAYVLAHTQHLKNKDIYEGGSKLVIALDASDLGQSEHEVLRNRLYKLQYSMTNALLDIFITSNGITADQRVVDYYRDDEAIEIGPDENMHDEMIEAIASLSQKRGYMLGCGIISSKRAGIGHKEYGVTSTGVVCFARITMAEVIGLDISRDPFTLKMTGGPNGDVAGNCLRIMLEGCPQMQIKLILDGTAAICDPDGINRSELGRITLKSDLDSFNTDFLNHNGFIIYRTGRKMDGLKEKYLKRSRQGERITEEWLDADDFHRDYNRLIFTTKADLFIPAGGRPETIDVNNWQLFLDEQGNPTSRIIIEGANSFLTPEARNQLQKHGVVIMRDSSANKCGVISSSYEIIANLLLSETEFLEHKTEYVQDVLTILKKRAEDEARLILARWHASNQTLPCTEISAAISHEIIEQYSRLFTFFATRPELCLKHPFKKALRSHLPAMLQNRTKFRQRIKNLPTKYLAAILAAEIGSSLVYTGNREADFEAMIRRHLTITL